MTTMKNPLTFSFFTVPSGTKLSREIALPDGEHSLPLIVINGQDDGKLLLITAAVHGFEYPGVVACCRLAELLDPGQMHGGVVILPIVNTSGFYGRLPYVCSDDEGRRNLNELSPGDPTGSFGERLMAFLLDTFVSRADFHIDLHSGDATESLVPFAAACNSPNAAARQLSHGLLSHTSFSRRIQSAGRHEFYNASAIDRGVPSALFEVGGGGLWTADEVEREVEDLLRAAQFLGILSGTPPRNTAQVLLQRQTWVTAKHSGLLYPAVRVGEHVCRGQVLAEIKTVFGELLETIVAEYDGEMLIVTTSLGISTGDDVCCYAAP